MVKKKKDASLWNKNLGFELRRGALENEIDDFIAFFESNDLAIIFKEDYVKTILERLKKIKESIYSLEE